MPRLFAFSSVGFPFLVSAFLAFAFYSSHGSRLSAPAIPLD
jgi:hypothetical protein